MIRAGECSVGCGSVGKKVGLCTRACRKSTLKNARGGKNVNCFLHLIGVERWDDVDLTWDWVNVCRRIVAIVGVVVVSGGVVVVIL